MKRREFVQRLPVWSAGLVAGASSLSAGACAGVIFLTPREEGSALLISRDALVEPLGAFVAHPHSRRPIYLREIAPDRFVALWARCTHKGCRPEPASDRLVCPCHGSEFSVKGEVLEGPAERPLTRYDVTTDGGDVVIWLQRRMS